MNINIFSKRAAFSFSQWSAILIGFSVPISTVLDNLLLAAVLLALLFNTRAVWQLAVHHPVARAAWLLFGILSCAIFYGSTPLTEASGVLGKYMDLAFIPLLMLLLSDEPNRQRAKQAFLASMGLTLALSYLVGLQLLAPQHWMTEFAAYNNPVIFHSHITQNNMMAFAIFLTLLKLRDSASLKQKVGWGIFALMGSINVLFMVQGRTGYLIMVALLAWFILSSLAHRMEQRGKTLNLRQGTVVLLILGGLMAVTYQTSPRLHDRIGLVVSEFQAWQPNHGKNTSTGQRLDFYYNTLKVIQNQPLLGVGTGGFNAAFAHQIQGTEAKPTHNPHNEYLMIAVQTGIIGAGLLLYLFYTQWRTAPLLPTLFEQDAARGLVLAYMINGAFNSALHDHADGLFFAFMTAVLFSNLRLRQHA